MPMMWLMRGPSGRSPGPTGDPPHAARRCAAPDRPSRRRRWNERRRTSPGESFTPTSLVRSATIAAPISNEARRCAACRHGRRQDRASHGARRRRRYSRRRLPPSRWRARAPRRLRRDAVRRRRSSGRNSCRMKCSGKRASATSMLPNLMPPAECHSPALGHPSPAGDAPPPGRAWNRCQMNLRRVRGSVPAMAMRKRRPHPAMARSGHASASAVMIASTISFEQWLVQSVTGAPSFAQTTVPGFAITRRSAERAVVLRDVGIDQIGERHRDGRLHVGVRGVHEAGALRIGRRQIDRQIRARLGHARADHDVLAAMPVVVERRMPFVDTVAPGSDHRAGAPLGGVQHRLDRGEQPRRAELLEQRREPALRQPRRADHRGKIATKIAAVPHVGGEQPRRCRHAGRPCRRASAAGCGCPPARSPSRRDCMRRASRLRCRSGARG